LCQEDYGKTRNLKITISGHITFETSFVLICFPFLLVVIRISWRQILCFVTREYRPSFLCWKWNAPLKRAIAFAIRAITKPTNKTKVTTSNNYNSNKCKGVVEFSFSAYYFCGKCPRQSKKSTTIVSNRIIFYRCSQEGIRRAIGGIEPKKTTKVTLFTMNLYNLENSILDIRPFCRPLFCHSSVVKYTSSVLQQWTRNETWLPNNIEIAPPNLAGSASGRCCFVSWWTLG